MKETNLTTWSDDQLLDVLKIMIKAQPRDISVMDAKDEAIVLLREELIKRPHVLFQFVEKRLMFDK